MSTIPDTKKPEEKKATSTTIHRCKLAEPVVYRYEVWQGGRVDRKVRGSTRGMYGCPIQQGSADGYVWEDEPGRYVVSVKAETQPRGTNFKRAMGCYHVVPTFDAAVMFAISAGGE